MIEVRQTGVQAQIDGGANSNIFGDISLFHTFTPKQGIIQQVTGETGTYDGIGIVLIRIDQQLIIPLYPTYLMRGNPQNTISPTAIKKYNECRSVRMEALDWIRITNHEGKSVRIHTDQKLINSEALDYIKVDIMETSTKQCQIEYISRPSTSRNYPSEISTPPMINHAFSKNESLDRTMIHRRLGHLSHDKILKMTKLKTITDLPQRISKSHNPQCKCIICLKASSVHFPKGMTMSTENLLPGQLIHMDFCFIEIESIRKFTCALIIVDAKTRKVWTFCTPNKRPPLATVRYFLTQLKQINRQAMNIRTDLGGELARSSEFCSMLMEEFQCGLQTTGGYSSWLNGKSKRHIRTIENISRRLQGDANLPSHLLCFSFEHATDILGATIHDATN